jgi:hypothetical protein
MADPEDCFEVIASACVNLKHRLKMAVKLLRVAVSPTKDY